MSDPINALLEKLAARCISSAAGMLATTIASMQIAHDSRRQQQLEELAKDLEGQGLTDVARLLRERAHLLAIEQPTSTAVLRDDSQTQESLIPANGTLPLRRPGRRPKRTEEAASTSDGQSEPPVDPSLFFPLNAQASAKPGESEHA